MEPVSRFRILQLTALTAGCHVSLAAVVYMLLWRDRRPVIVGLIFAVSFTQTVSLLLISAILAIRRAYREFARTRSRRMGPSIRGLFAATLAGGGAPSPALLALAKRHPRGVEECCVEMLPALKGARRQVASALAVECGAVAQWETAIDSWNVRRRRRAARALALLSPEYSDRGRNRMLRCADAELRLAALRMTARAGHPQGLVEVISRLAGLCLFERALLSEDLKAHATFLCQDAVPGILQSRDSAAILAVLQLLNSWKRTVRLAPLRALLSHGEAQIRAAALLALPYEVEAYLSAPDVLTRLQDPAPEVRSAAAIADGRLRLEGSLTALSEGLRDADLEVAGQCAYAIAGFGQAGIDLLESQIVSAGPEAAAVAMEAVQSARVGRVGAWT